MFNPPRQGPLVGVLLNENDGVRVKVFFCIAELTEWDLDTSTATLRPQLSRQFMMPRLCCDLGSRGLSKNTVPIWVP